MGQRGDVHYVRNSARTKWEELPFGIDSMFGLLLPMAGNQHAPWRRRTRRCVRHLRVVLHSPCGDPPIAHLHGTHRYTTGEATAVRASSKTRW